MRRVLAVMIAVLVGVALAAVLPSFAGISGGGGGGGGITPNRYISGFRIQVTGNATISVTAGSAMDRGNTVLFSNGATITTATPFAAWADGNTFGLDTGTEAASTWYHLHWIRDATVSEGVLLSTSKTAPSMPAGATLRRWIGAVRNDASSNLLQCEYDGTGQRRTATYRNEDILSAPLNVLVAGAATTPTAISLTAVAPPQASAAWIYMFPANAVSLSLYHGAETVIAVRTQSLASGELGPALLFQNGNQIQYAGVGADAAGYVYCTGFSLSLDGSD